MHFLPKPIKVNSLPYLQQGSIVAARYGRHSTKDTARCPDVMGQIVTPTGHAKPIIKSLTQTGQVHYAAAFHSIAIIGDMQK